MASRTAVPHSVRDALGDQASEDLATWVETVVSQNSVTRDEFRQVLSRLDVLEHDMSDLKSEVRALRTEMNERFDRMNERFDRMNERMLEQTRWLIGSIVVFGTILSILSAISTLFK